MQALILGLGFRGVVVALLLACVVPVGLYLLDEQNALTLGVHEVLHTGVGENT